MPVAFVCTKQNLKRTLARLQPRIREYLSLESEYELAQIALLFRPTKRRKTCVRAMGARLGVLRKQLAAMSAVEVAR